MTTPLALNGRARSWQPDSPAPVAAQRLPQDLQQRVAAAVSDCAGWTRAYPSSVVWAQGAVIVAGIQVTPRSSEYQTSFIKKGAAA